MKESIREIVNQNMDGKINELKESMAQMTKETVSELKKINKNLQRGKDGDL